jgi:hypothetical protein
MFVSDYGSCVRDEQSIKGPDDRSLVLDFFWIDRRNTLSEQSHYEVVRVVENQRGNSPAVGVTTAYATSKSKQPWTRFYQLPTQKLFSKQKKHNDRHRRALNSFRKGYP